MSNYHKCDVCNDFCDEAGLDSVTIVVSKHKTCNVNELFGKKIAIKEAINLPRLEPQFGGPVTIESQPNVKVTATMNGQPVDINNLKSIQANG